MVTRSGDNSPPSERSAGSTTYLNESLHESDVRNHGVSAFRGANMVKGPLAKFIALVDAGVVKPGSWLLVEDIDRLTRGVHTKAYGLCLLLFEKGIRIATLMDGEVYDLNRSTPVSKNG